MHNENEHETLKERIKALQASTEEQPSASAKNSGMGVVAEFTGPILTGVLLGYYADKFFATHPFLLIVGILIGFVTAIVNCYRYL